MTDIPPPPPPAPAQGPPSVEVKANFTPGPASIRAQRVHLGNQVAIVVVLQTPSTAVTTFWGEEDFRAALDKMRGALSGLEVPNIVDAASLLRPPSGPNGGPPTP